MAIIEKDSPSETTIMGGVNGVKSELKRLQLGLKQFLHIPELKQGEPIPCYLDPISEIVANLQDCKRLIQDIERLALDKITKRIME